MTMNIFDDKLTRKAGDSGPKLRWVWGGERGAAEGTLLLELRFPESRRRGVYHLHLVLDVSTSMREHDRFGAALQALRMAIGVLRDNDRFSLTLFSHEAASVVQGATARWCRANMGEVERRIRDSGLLFTPKTYLEGAVQRLLPVHPGTSGWSTRVVILTDGEIMDAGACAVLSADVSRNVEIRALGFGREYHPDRIREAFVQANLGPVQAAGSLGQMMSQVEHLAEAGERVIGNDARIRFMANYGLEKVVCARPSIRGLERDGSGGFVDHRPLLESGRKYIYLLDVAARAPNPAEGRLEISYRSTGDGRTVSFSSTFVLFPAWGSYPVDPVEVKSWRALTVTRAPEDVEVLIRELEAVRELILRQDNPDLEQKRRIETMLEWLRSERAGRTGEARRFVEDSMTKAIPEFGMHE